MGVQFHRLRPVKVILGGYCLAFAAGIPIRASKPFPVNGLSPKDDPVILIFSILIFNFEIM